MITWHEPTFNNNHGEWGIKIEGLNRHEVEQVWKHDLVRNGFVFPNPASGKAYPNLDVYTVRAMGAHRTWWMLREEIGVEPYYNLDSVDEFLRGLLDTDTDTDNDYDTDDTAPLAGTINW